MSLVISGGQWISMLRGDAVKNYKGYFLSLKTCFEERKLQHNISKIPVICSTRKKLTHWISHYSSSWHYTHLLASSSAFFAVKRFTIMLFPSQWVVQCFTSIFFTQMVLTYLLPSKLVIWLIINNWKLETIRKLYFTETVWP